MLQTNAKKIKSDLHYSIKILGQFMSDSDPDFQRKLGRQFGLRLLSLLLLIACLIFEVFILFFPQSS